MLGLMWATPALIVVAAVLMPIMRNANKDLFYYGTAGWSATRDGLAALWLRHIDREDHPIVGDGILDQFADSYGGSLLLVLSVLIALAALITAIRISRDKKRACLKDKGFVLLTLATMGFCLTVVLQSLVHRFLDLPLPRVRTALHLVFLASLGGVTAWIWFWNHGSFGRLLSGALMPVLATILFCQVSVAGADEFAEWTWDSGCRRVFDQLNKLRVGKDKLNVVSVPSRFAASQKYYRKLRSQKWLYVVEHNPNDTKTEFHYVLLAKSLLTDPRVAPALAEVVYSDKVSDCLIVKLKKR